MLQETAAVEVIAAESVSRLSAVVREICGSAPTLQRAAAELEGRIRGDKHLREELMEFALARICYELASDHFRKQRDASARLRSEADAERDGARLVAAMVTLLDFPLWDGTRLRDADKAKVRKSADHYLAQADTMRQRGRWLKAVAARTPAGKTVGQTLDAETLQKMYEKAAAGSGGST